MADAYYDPALEWTRFAGYTPLNKLEVPPWDTWRLATKEDDALTDAHLELCGRIAAVTQGDDVDLPEILALYETIEEVHLPPWLR